MTEGDRDLKTESRESLPPAVPVTPAALPRGHPLGGYRVLGTLGHGAFGIIYLALDRRLKLRVAIKEYFPQLLSRRDGADVIPLLGGADAETFATGLQKFKQEARRLARCRHPNIVHARSLLEANGTAYLVMDYEPGEDLATCLERRGRLPEESAVLLLIELLAALEVVHESGYVHRDIKPANIYLRHTGLPLLLDFGATREVLLRAGRHHTRILSPAFAPPELHTGNPEFVKPWSDIYSAGATLYRAITGQMPEDALTRKQYLENGRSDPLAPASDLAYGRYSTSLLQGIDRALAVDHNQRPATVAEWRQALLAGSDWTGLERRRGPHVVVRPSVPEPGDVFQDQLRDESLGPEMVMLPPGRFRMGSSAAEPGRDPDEGPVHTVTLTRGVAMARYPVTFEEYDCFASSMGRQLPFDRGLGRGRRAVVNVSWHDARAYADWLSEQTGKPYRLPSEAEWEYAARGGAESAYWWGDQPEPHRARCAGAGRQTALVGMFPPNGYGLYDTAGYVWEWVQDTWHRDYSGAPANGSPWESADGTERVLRGGCASGGVGSLRSAKRSHMAPIEMGWEVGFRVTRGF